MAEFKCRPGHTLHRHSNTE